MGEGKRVVEHVLTGWPPRAGRCPSPNLLHEVNIARTMAEVRKQLGVVYPGDAARPAKKLKA